MTVLATVGTVADHSGIPALIPQLLDHVWAHIRGHNIEGHGHNVVMYRNHGNELTAGVEVPSDTPEPPAPLVLATTPRGRAVCVRHVGPYSGIPQAVQQLFAFCGEQHLEPVEPTWEVYGDWNEDESKLVTDIYVSIAVN
jgi:effector-binding domain-containing protein